MPFINRFKGDGTPLPARPPLRSALLAGLGGILAIAVLAGLSDILTTTLLLGSFGASCVLIFGYPEAPFSQPRNVLFGHCLSSLIGLLFLTVCGPHWWSAALALGTAITAMLLTRTVHPPAGSNPVIVFLIQPGWSFLLLPTFAGAVLLLLTALLYHATVSRSRYPKYW